MDLGASLQQYIGQKANGLLQPYSAILPKSGSSMGLGYSASVSASSSASSGPSKSGDISGGTAFNIGGINLGTQGPNAVDAQGGSPAQSFAGALGGSYTPYILLAGVAVLAIVLLRR